MSIVFADPNESMFDIGANILINPVNCIGVMGGGLALEFKERYPAMFYDYYHCCQIGMKPGMIHTYRTGPSEFVFNVPAKDDLSDSTEMILKRSLVGLTLVLIGMRPLLLGAKIAIPALGCGLGGMEWNKVKDMILDFCNNEHLSEYNFVIFEPK